MATYLCTFFNSATFSNIADEYRYHLKNTLKHNVNKLKQFTIFAFVVNGETRILSYILCVKPRVINGFVTALVERIKEDRLIVEQDFSVLLGTCRKLS